MKIDSMLMAISLALLVIKLENVLEYKLFLFYSFSKVGGGSF